MSVVRLTGMSEQPLSVDQVRAAVADPALGGTALFIGTVRDRDEGRDVEKLSYVAHPSAPAELDRLAAKVAADTGVQALAAVHRVGDVKVGEVSVVVAAASAHRDDAFQACRALIEAVKRELPVWKCQQFRDGTSEWVNGA